MDAETLDAILRIQKERQEKKEKEDQRKERGLLTTRTKTSSDRPKNVPSTKRPEVRRPRTTESTAVMKIDSSPEVNFNEDLNKVLVAMKNNLNESAINISEDGSDVEEMANRGVSPNVTAMETFGINKSSGDGASFRVNIGEVDLGFVTFAGFRLSELLIFAGFVWFMIKLLYRCVRGKKKKCINGRIIDFK